MTALSISVVELVKTPWGIASTIKSRCSYDHFTTENPYINEKLKKISSVDILINQRATLTFLIEGSALFSITLFPKHRYIFCIPKNTIFSLSQISPLMTDEAMWLKALFLELPTRKNCSFIFQYLFFTPGKMNVNLPPHLTFILPTNYKTARNFYILRRRIRQNPHLVGLLVPWGHYSKKEYRTLGWLDLPESALRVNYLLTKFISSL